MALSLVPADACGSPDNYNPGSNGDRIRESPLESSSSRETWPVEHHIKEHFTVLRRVGKIKEAERDETERSVARCVPTSDKITFQSLTFE